MIYHTIADILAAGEQAQARFIAAVSNLTEAQANFRPDENQWTIAEIVEHISIVNDGFLRLTHKLLKEAESAAKPPKADLNLGHTILDEDGNQPPPFQAPDRVRPVVLRVMQAENGAVRGRSEVPGLSFSGGASGSQPA